MIGEWKKKSKHRLTIICRSPTRQSDHALTAAFSHSGTEPSVIPITTKRRSGCANGEIQDR